LDYNSRQFVEDFRELAVARIPDQATGTRPADRLALPIADPDSPLAAPVDQLAGDP
jgi:hypothetical protein